MKLKPIKSFQKNYSQSNATETKLTKKKQDEKYRLVCQLDSVLTKLSSESTAHVLNVKASDGCMISLQWANKDKPLPEIGDVLFVEFLDQKTDTNSEITSDVEISDLQVFVSSYDLSYLDMLFHHAERPKDLVRLLQFIARIHDERVQQLLTELFQEKDIAVPFITLPASHNHHHNFAGGLLLHSIECAELIETTAYSTLSTCEADLTLVTALLHDLGKVETMNSANKRQFVPHEALSLLLIEPFLMKLQKQWQQGADALRAMLSFLMSSTQFPQFPGLVLVKMADQFSSSIAARKMAFEGTPDHFYFSRLQTPSATQFFNRLTVS